ncbi:phosphate propanoyltransferase [Breoghania sp.]|uniref:phosphate propanoyltransferase n=1 Tax=Breoghania sp. TaxID=2065378 RepID=UPI0029CA6073|nr:phosphate propanoyltransferase [Breoghania sp.]
MQPVDDTIALIVSQIMAESRIAARKATEREKASASGLVPVGVSNRHLHLSRCDMDALFGPGSELTRKKAMKQPGQYAAEETVTLRGPKGDLRKVRVLGPLRKETQIEISVADGFVLGVKPPLRMSGKLAGSPGVEIIGPAGSVKKDDGVIAAQRHIHMLPETAASLGLVNGEEVAVEVQGPRGGVMEHVVVRVAENSALELHIDIEEANALGLKNDDLVRILKA